MYKRFFALKSNHCDKPSAATWLPYLQQQIEVDGDSCEAFLCESSLKWAYALCSSTKEHNFTSEALEIMEQMCAPRFNLSVCWREIEASEFAALKLEIERLNREVAEHDRELAKRRGAVINDGYTAHGSGGYGVGGGLLHSDRDPGR